MDPAILERLPKDEHLGRMLGIWAGRIVEETVADEKNQMLVTTITDDGSSYCAFWIKHPSQVRK